MSAKLGAADAAFRLGAVTPAAVYLGATQVWSAVTVPGAPTITFASPFAVQFTVPNDGGSAILFYRVYVNDSGSPTQDNVIDVGGGELQDLGLMSNDTVRISAVNALGEGPLSAPATVP